MPKPKALSVTTVCMPQHWSRVETWNQIQECQGLWIWIIQVTRLQHLGANWKACFVPMVRWTFETRLNTSSIGISMARGKCFAGLLLLQFLSDGHFLKVSILAFHQKKHVPMHPPMSLLKEPLRKPPKFVKIIQLIDPVCWLLVPIMGAWIQVDGCSLHGYDHPFFGLYRPGMAPKWKSCWTKVAEATLSWKGDSQLIRNTLNT